MSTENSGLKLDGSRLVPNLFRGSATTTTAAAGQQQPAGIPGTATGQQQQPPQKLGYRSMVSVDDVPELFASLDSNDSSFSSAPLFQLTFTLDLVTPLI